MATENRNRIDLRDYMTTFVATNGNRAITGAVLQDVLDNFIESLFSRKTDSFIPYAVTAGSSNTFTVGIVGSYPDSLSTGYPFLIKTNRANTGNATITLNSLANTSWRKQNGTQYGSGEIKENSYYFVIYDGTNFVTLMSSDVSVGNIIETTSTTETLSIDSLYIYEGTSNAVFTLPTGSDAIKNKPIRVLNDTINGSIITMSTTDSFTANFGGVIYQGSNYTFIWTGTKWAVLN